MNTGEIIIKAVIRANALEEAEEVEGGAKIFVWATDAAEQIEAALNEAGYELRKK